MGKDNKRKWKNKSNKEKELGLNTSLKWFKPVKKILQAKKK